MARATIAPAFQCEQQPSPNVRNMFAMRAIAASLCLALTACATKGETGALLGAAVGAVIGKAVGGRDGAIAGALIGGILGGGIGASMDADDKRKLAEARAAAAKSASRQMFYSASAKATVVVEPSQSTYKPGTKIALASDLVDRPLIEQTPFTISAYVNTPIYAAPTFDASPKLTIPAGEPITTVAQVRDMDDWVVVGTAGYGLGYAHRKMLDTQARTDVENALRSSESTSVGTKPIAAKIAKSDKRTVSKAPPRSATKPAAVDKPSNPSTTDGLLASGVSYLPPTSHLQATASDAASYNKSLDQGREQSRAAIISGGSGGEVRVVNTSVECRDLTSILLSNNKEVGREKTTACKKSDGSWNA